MGPEQKAALEALQKDWNGHGAEPPTQVAIDAAFTAVAVPTGRGGVQVEWHVGGMDIEVEFDDAGNFESCIVGRS